MTGLESLPDWVKILVAVAAALTAVGVIWRTVVKPSYNVVKRADDMMPVLNRLTVALKDTPGAFLILKEIIGQFRTDSGSSMRDVINRLEVASIKNRQATEELVINLEVQRKLMESDRRQVERLITLINVVASKQAAHLELTTQAVRSSMDNKGLIQEVVADLADTHERAAAIEEGAEPGAAADAGARTEPITPKA